MTPLIDLPQYSRSQYACRLETLYNNCYVIYTRQAPSRERLIRCPHEIRPPECNIPPLWISITVYLYSVSLSCQRSFNVAIGLDKASRISILLRGVSEFTLYYISFLLRYEPGPVPNANVCSVEYTGTRGMLGGSIASSYRSVGCRYIELVPNLKGVFGTALRPYPTLPKPSIGYLPSRYP